MDFDLLLAWCLLHIGCDMCSAAEGANLQSDGRFICPADVRLLQMISKPKEATE